MNNCAICGKRNAFIRNSLCLICYKNYRNENWAKELIKIESHNNYIDKKLNTVSFEELPTDFTLLDNFIDY